jgi:hypothetical protein
VTRRRSGLVEAARGRLFAIAALALAVGAARAEPLACAIRWDAWYTNGPHDPGAYTAAALGLPAWRGRAPLHARIDANGKIVWAATQATFDAEIKAAARAHLCWVYLAYGDRGVIDLAHPMMRGLRLHLNSVIRDEVRYALMTTPSLLIGADRKAALAATLSLMQGSVYQSVVIAGARRPLLFVFFESPQAFARPDRREALRAALDALRTASRSRGLGNPYIVVTLAGAKAAEEMRAALGADAISQYVAGRRRGHQSWATFEPSIEADWSAYAAAAAADVVPTLRTGADIRARCQTPPPFERRFPPGSRCDDYVDNPSLEQLEQEFRHARSWIEARSGRDPARLMLVYAWSECDESGNCLMPTYGDADGLKIDAIARALGR